jgi:hypothetical protein
VGATLTVEPSVVVKMNGVGRSLIVNGGLLADASNSPAIYFTSLQDDSVLGDTAVDGPTVGAVGQWSQIKIAGSALMRNTVVRFGGYGFGDSNAEIYVTSSASTVNVSNASVTKSKTTGVSAYSSGLAIDNSTISNNLKSGVYTDHARIRIDGSRIESNGEWGAKLLFNSAPYPEASQFHNNEISANTAGGVWLWGASGAPASSWPVGQYNNLYGNAPSNPSSLQLFSTGLSPTVPVDWAHNYWGPNVHWVVNPSGCGSSGYLGFNGSGTPTAPTVLYWWGVFPSTDCYVNLPRIVADQWSSVPYELNPPPPDPLLLEYAPELRYAAVENYRADSPAEMTDNFNNYYTNKLQAGDQSVIAAANPARLDPPGNQQVPPLSLDFLDTTYPGTSLVANAADHIDELDNTGSVPADAQPIDSQRMHALPQYANRTYGQMWPDAGTGEKILQYWLFYYYNSKADPTINIGLHEGDWEMVQIRVASDGSPIDARYAQHREGERCEWSRVQKSEAGHPVVYVAVDSHASYFTPGDHDYLSGIETDWAPGDDLVRVVPEVVDTSGNPGWVRWPGIWGGSEASPQGPRFQGAKSSDPFGWQSGAGGCSAPIQSRRFTGAGRLKSATRALPPLPRVKAEIRGKRVFVTYRFDTFPSGRDTRPWVLITAVKPSGKRFGPVAQHTLIRRRSGRFSQPLGAGRGPFQLFVAVRARSGVSNGTLRLPLR